jgi:predicted lipid-binding transport protein (Tim44 family)
VRVATDLLVLREALARVTDRDFVGIRWPAGVVTGVVTGIASAIRGRCQRRRLVAAAGSGKRKQSQSFQHERSMAHDTAGQQEAYRRPAAPGRARGVPGPAAEGCTAIGGSG